MRHAANTIDALDTAIEDSSMSRKGASALGSRQGTSLTQFPAARGGGIAHRRPQPPQSIAKARTPVRQPAPPYDDARSEVRQLNNDMDITPSMEGLLDAEFDDLGCDLGMLLRLANGP